MITFPFKFYQSVKVFDPESESIPRRLPKKLTEIVERCRALIGLEPHERIVAAAQVSEAVIDDFFEAERCALIDRILENGSWELSYLPEDKRNEEGLSDLLDDWPSDAVKPEPEYRQHHNTSKFEALRDGFKLDFLNTYSENPGWTEAQYFTVHALRMIRECLDSVTNPPNEFHELIDGAHRLVDSLGASPRWPKYHQDALAVDHLLEALEAVTWAEKQHALHEQTTRLQSLMTAKAEEAFSVRASKLARKASDARHLENRQMKMDVWEWCESNLDTYPSMDKAAEFIVHEIRLVPVTFRTVRDWVSQYRRRLRSARTP